VTASTVYLVGSLILAILVAFFGAYRFFANKTTTAIKDANAVGVAKGVQDSALRDNTAALREMKLSMDKYVERIDHRLSAHAARLAVSETRLDILEHRRPGRQFNSEATDSEGGA
jgi:hypothetical protein